MNRAELIQKIKQLDDEDTKTSISSVLNALTDVIKDAMASGDTVTLPGLGKFSVKDTAERQAWNPQANKPITIPAGRKVTFKLASALKAVVK